MSPEPKPFSPAYATLEALKALADVWNASPPMRQLGARLEFDRVDRVRAVIDPVMPYHRGGIGTEAVNGPVLVAFGVTNVSTTPVHDSASSAASSTSRSGPWDG